MPYSHLNDYPADIRERAARIRLACFDVDGTLTDGRLFFDSEGVELKAFHVHDGQGLVLLRKSGIAVAFVTARASAVAEQRAAELGIARPHRGRRQAGLRAGHRRAAGHRPGRSRLHGRRPARPARDVAGRSAVAPANAHRLGARARALAHQAARRPWRRARIVRPAAGRAGPCRGVAGAKSPAIKASASRATHELARRSSRPCCWSARTAQRLVGLEPARQGRRRATWRDAAPTTCSSDFELIALNKQGQESFTLRAPRLARDRAEDDGHRHATVPDPAREGSQRPALGSAFQDRLGQRRRRRTAPARRRHGASTNKDGKPVMHGHRRAERFPR